MVFEDQTSKALRHAQSAETWRVALGKSLTGLRRYVLGLGTSNDERGHGVTELEFAQFMAVVIKPGANEDYIVTERQAVSNLDPEYWTEIDAEKVETWKALLGSRLSRVEFYTDGTDDVAIVAYFDNGKTLSFVLCDTDLVVAQLLEPLDTAGERSAPRLREVIE